MPKNRIVGLMSALFRRRDPDRDIDEEFATHLALETDRQEEHGLPPDQARHAALRRFGSPLRYRQETREVRTLLWWESLYHDLRGAGRVIARRRVASLAAMAALGVGMGGPAAVLAVILSTSTLVSPSVSNPDELVILWETPPRQPNQRRDVSPDTYRVWREHASVIGRISAAGSPLVLALTTGDTPERVSVQTMGVDLLPVLGVTPTQGRAFAERDAEADADPVALVSHAFWETHLGSRPDVVGSTIELHGQHRTIVGVMPRAFWFGARGVDVWVPLPAGDAAAPVLVVARMPPGERKDHVDARLRALAPQVAAAQPAREGGWSTRVDGLGVRELLNGDDLAPGFKLLLVAAVLGLLAACANIATVMVARGAARHLETALRAALGAPRSRLVRQFLLESIVVALGGGALALVLTYAGLRLIAANAPADIASAIDVTLDGGLVLAIAVVSLAIGLVAGLGPALADSRVNLVLALKNSGYFGSVPGHSRIRRVLIVAEVTITVILLASVTMLARSAIELSSVGAGVDGAHVLAIRIDPVRHIGRSPGRPLDLDTLLERFGRINAVEAVALAQAVPPYPGRRYNVAIPASADAAAREQQRVPVNAVGEAYFRALGLRLIEGRLLEAGDRHGAPVAVVSEVFARQNFADRTALGRALRIGDDPFERTIVGVVSNILIEGFRREPSPIVYVPYASMTPPAGESPDLVLVVRHAPGAAVIPDLRQALATIDRLQTIQSANSVEEQLGVAAQEIRATIYLAGPVIVLALLLTMSGIYGLLAQSVTQRTHEVAVRVALGAGRIDVLRLVVLQGLRLAGIGAVTGAAGALALDRLLGSFIVGVPGGRPMALVIAVVLIVAATLVASIAPCVRAMHIDPGKTLKYE